MLDTEGEPLRLGVEAEPDLVSPNQREAEELVGQEFEDEEDFLMALDAIAELGARNVLITPETGCFALLREDRSVRAPAGRRRRASSRSRPSVRATCCSRSSSRRASARRPAEEALRQRVGAGAASVLEVGAGRFDPREASAACAGVDASRARARRPGTRPPGLDRQRGALLRDAGISSDGTFER